MKCWKYFYHSGVKKKTTSKGAPKLTAAQGKPFSINDWFATVSVIAGETPVKKSKPKTKAKAVKFEGLPEKDRTAYSEISTIDSGLYFRKHMKKHWLCMIIEIKRSQTHHVLLFWSLKFWIKALVLFTKDSTGIIFGLNRFKVHFYWFWLVCFA